MNKFLTKFPKFLFLHISFILSLSEPLMASEPLKEEADELLYKKGLEYRNSGNTQQAIECFKPLAKKGHVRAQHNLAMQYYTTNDESNAYKWFKLASDQEFLPSQNNLKRLNLFFLLLPNESLCHIASFLDLKSLSNFKFVSSKAYRIFLTTITRTNFLTSQNPYASDFRLRFSQVIFEPQPKSIRMVRSVTTDSGPIMVHFRDPKHLREIVEETPQINSKDRIYFVKDEVVEDGREILAPEGLTQKAFLVHIIADAPLKPKGKLNLPCEMVLPPASDINAFEYRGKSVSFNVLQAYEDAHYLASSIETFNEQLFKLRTNDATELLENRLKERSKIPTKFPSLMSLCPNITLMSGTEAVKISQNDYISSYKPLIYIADSTISLKELLKRLPEFSKSICYISPTMNQAGVYCSGPLYLQMGHEIFSEEDITIIGTINLNDYNLTITSKGSVWLIGTSIKTNGSIRVSYKKTLHLASLSRIFNENKKPDGMPEAHWKILLHKYESNGFFI